ncbi:MAG TPA: pectate lyase [Candidatus Acidoferrum sp.]|nr:pectate lyase [Candidatus Acidoferrum sp.]
MKLVIMFLLATLACQAAELAKTLRDDATRAMDIGIKFFSREVAVEGTYLWQYSDDLQKREGEGKASVTQGWIQPPGTPAVGMALLDAWRATSNRLHLDAARETARGLLRAQVRSGGWHYAVDFDPAARGKVAYRDGGGTRRARNVTTFDDDTTQAALRFLVRMDETLGFGDTNIAEAISQALNAIFKVQYPNGAWPQGYEEFPDAVKFPVKRASYPAEWPRTWPGSQQYWLRYTLNDNALATIVESLFDVTRTYKSTRAGKARNDLATRAEAAARKAGDFLLLAQMPEPQPAWAQQYDFDMHPTWARKFEPPSVSAGESRGVLRILMKLYRETGERKYLEPIPRALDYLRRCRLPDGKLARFYELRSNRPLYFTRDYTLTYDDRDVPTHYAFKIADDLDAITREFNAVKALSVADLKRNASPPPKASPDIEREVRAIIAAQDARGRWVEEGRLRYHGADDSSTNVIRSATFIHNVQTLSRYLEATKVPSSADQ